MPTETRFVVEPIGKDLVAVARCMAIEAASLPTLSVRYGLELEEPACKVWVARDDERRVVGFVNVVARQEVATILALAVDSGRRRRGVGRALVDRAVRYARARRVRALALQVSIANAPAIALYERAGFELSRRLPNFYAPGLYDVDDAYEMVLTLR